jgi:hypothetical protein
MCTKSTAIKACITVLLALCPMYLNAQGLDTLWTKTYDGLGYEEGYSIQQTADGGFIIAGSTGSSTYVRDVYLVKTDSLGDTLWTKTYGGNDDDRGWEVMCTSDNGFMIAGYTGSFGAGDHDFYLIRTDSLGDTIWTRTYGGPEQDRCYAACYTSDHGCILAGRTLSFGGGEYDFYVVKTDSLGDTLWTKAYGGAYRDVCISVEQTTDKGHIFVGAAEAVPEIYDVCLLKTDSLGDTLWVKRYGGGGDDAAYSVRQTSDNGYIVAGLTCSHDGGDPAVYLLRTDTNGDSLWSRYWGGTSTEFGKSVIQTPNGRFTVAARDDRDYGANNDSDIWLLRVDPAGDTLWTTHYGDGNHDEWPESMVRTFDGGYAIVGRKAPYAWELGDIYLVKTAPDTSGVLEYRNFPTKNYYMSATIISSPLLLPEGKKCRVFDITGRVVAPDKIQPGVYFLQVDERIVQKIVKIR